jgi:alkylation response protein AidB-like acyl-CoA dehydrogenase
MHTRNFVGRLIAAGLALLFMTAAPLALAEKYDGVTVTFDKPIAEVQKAAVDALTTVGVTLNKQEANLVEGKRKNKVGFMVGSGGEILSVALTEVEAGKTSAKVRTTKTFVGRAGQKVWDQQVLDEMSKVLGVSNPAGAPPAATAATN